MSSEYVPFQILTAEELNSSFDGKTDNADAKITGGFADGLDHITVTGVTPSITPTSGALIVTGGVGVGLSLNVGGQLFVSKEGRILSSLASTSKTTGALTVSGGVGVGGDIYAGGSVRSEGVIAGTRVVSSDVTQAVSPTTGAVTTAGGLGVAKDAWIGGALHVQGAFSAAGGATLAGNITVDSVTLNPGGKVTYGDGTIQTTKPMDDALADGSKYGRRNNAWVILTDLAEAPSDGTKYARRNAAWVALTDVPDAPSDAFYYGRRNNAWSKVTEEAPIGDAFIYGRANGLWAKTVPEAPTDGQQYSRRNGAWQVLSASGLVVASTPPTDTARFPMWWDTVSGTLYVWYDDGNSAQWVICVPTDAIGAAAGTATWGGITGTLSNQLDLQAALDLKANKASPSLTGTPVTVTPAVNDSSKQITNSEWFFGQKASVTPLMNGVAAIGNGTRWAAENHVHPSDTTKIGDAPNDTNTYGRKGGAWTTITSIAEAPLDGQLYGRQSGNWAVVTSGGGGSDPKWVLTTDGNNVVGTLLAPNQTLASGTAELVLQGSAGSNVPKITFKQGTNEIASWRVNSNSLRAYCGGTEALVISNTGISSAMTQYNLGNAGSTSPAINLGTISGGGSINTSFTFNRRATGAAAIKAYTLGSQRWQVNLADATAETGSNAGSNFSISAYDDAGAKLGDAIFINRGLMSVAFGGSTFSVGPIESGDADCRKPGGGPWADSSDERIKENVTDYTSGLAEVVALRPVNYTFKAETGRDTTRKYTGLIAQDAEQAMPELVTTGKGKLGEIELDDMRTLDSSALIYALVNSVKELNTRLAAVEAK